MGQGPTHALVEQDKEKADAVSLGGEEWVKGPVDPPACKLQSAPIVFR